MGKRLEAAGKTQAAGKMMEAVGKTEAVGKMMEVVGKMEAAGKMMEAAGKTEAVGNRGKLGYHPGVDVKILAVDILANRGRMQGAPVTSPC